MFLRGHRCKARVFPQGVGPGTAWFSAGIGWDFSSCSSVLLPGLWPLPGFISFLGCKHEDFTVTRACWQHPNSCMASSRSTSVYIVSLYVISFISFFLSSSIRITSRYLSVLFLCKGRCDSTFIIVSWKLEGHAERPRGNVMKHGSVKRREKRSVMGGKKILVYSRHRYLGLSEWRGADGRCVLFD